MKIGQVERVGDREVPGVPDWQNNPVPTEPERAPEKKEKEKQDA